MFNVFSPKRLTARLAVVFGKRQKNIFRLRVVFGIFDCKFRFQVIKILNDAERKLSFSNIDELTCSEIVWIKTANSSRTFDGYTEFFGLPFMLPQNL